MAEQNRGEDGYPEWEPTEAEQRAYEDAPYDRLEDQAHGPITDAEREAWMAEQEALIAPEALVSEREAWQAIVLEFTQSAQHLQDRLDAIGQPAHSPEQHREEGMSY